jgi:glycosyltransferase involved in cell wall biosynthesis
LCQTQANVSSERVLYAPYGVNPDPGHPLGDPTPHSPLKLAWVGRLDQDQKRVHDLPAILDELDRIGIVAQLSIAGDGAEEASLRAALGPRLQRGQVRFLGRLTPEALAKLVYQDHDVLLITSSWETGPIVAWEAMAAGLAVVSSRYVGSGLEGALLAEVTALLFPVGDATRAAIQLARLQDPELRRQLRRAGHQLVLQRYSRNQSCRAWEQAFERTLSLPPLARPPAVPPLPAQGRLDRWLGPNRAEDLRRLLKIQFKHSSPGGEWPHALHPGACDEATLLTLAAALEAEGGS